MDLGFSTSREIVERLSKRLRQERLAQKLTQADVAARAGVGVNTVSNLEAGRNVSFDSVVRVAMLLGRVEELEGLFKPRLESLNDFLRYEESAHRQRIRPKRDHA